MKQYILIIVVMFTIATFFIIGDKKSEENPKGDRTTINVSEKNDGTKLSNNKIRAIYFSYIELEEYIKGKSSDEAKKNIDDIIDNLAKDGFNWLILHVRAFSDSVYPSKIFPSSKNVTDDELPFDILDYFIKKAHQKDIEIHAWINPYRIASDDNFVIDKNHPAYKFLGTNNIQKIEGKGLYYNPASEEVIALIVSGVAEIINNYDVDGIHLDDYFYPSKDIDDVNYIEYQKNGGQLSHSEYRLDNVLKMIKNIHDVIKKKSDKILFGIAPEGNIDNNYSSNYLDVKKILSCHDYVDYIMPQIYFGFLNENRPYQENIQDWEKLIKDDSLLLIPALALYKSGNDDKYAGSGKNEWIDNTDILKKQIVYSQNIPHYAGFSIFRYAFFYNSKKQNDNMVREVQNIREILK